VKLKDVKTFIQRLTLFFILMGGMFIGFARGPQAKSKWMFKMKNKRESKNAERVNSDYAIKLDDYEIAAFH